MSDSHFSYDGIEDALAYIDVKKAIMPILESAYMTGYDNGYNDCHLDEQSNMSYKLGWADAYDALRSALCDARIDSKTLKAFDDAYNELYGELT